MDLTSFFKNKAIESLCTGCGTCVGVCPTNVLEMRRNYRGIYLPTLKNYKLCIKCKLCLKVCPEYSTNLLEPYLFNACHSNTLIGKYIDCYLGHATDRSLRSASGGIVTALTGFALDMGFINGAVVTTLSETNPSEPRVIIAKTKKDIVSASGSKYCPVPTNIAIKKLLNKNAEKFAFVGLPCHIRGIRKAEKILKDLREKIVIHIGLFCSHTVNFAGTEFLLQKMGIRDEIVSRLYYRSKGWWNGGLTVELKDGSERFLPLSIYWTCFLSRFFIPLHCLLCSDLTNELTDISVGDAWLPSLKGHNEGFSVILVRTKVGKKLLERVKRSGKIKIIKIGSYEVIRSQKRSLLFKKRSLGARRFIFKLFGMYACTSSASNANVIQPRITDYLGALLCYLNFEISNKKVFQKILKYTPLSLLKVYNKLMW